MAKKTTLQISTQVNEAWLLSDLTRLVDGGMDIDVAKRQLNIGKYMRVDVRKTEAPEPQTDEQGNTPSEDPPPVPMGG